MEKQNTSWGIDTPYGLAPKIEALANDFRARTPESSIVDTKLVREWLYGGGYGELKTDAYHFIGISPLNLMAAYCELYLRRQKAQAQEIERDLYRSAARHRLAASKHAWNRQQGAPGTIEPGTYEGETLSGQKFRAVVGFGDGADGPRNYIDHFLPRFSGEKEITHSVRGDIYFPSLRKIQSAV